MTEPCATRLLENAYVAVKRCRHGFFAYNLNDTYIGRSLDRYGEWCEEELSLLFQVVKPGSVVVDVGANIGTHSVALARHVTGDGAVLAVEPQRIVFQLLCANVALNALPNVECVKAVAAESPGEILVPTLNPTLAMNYGGLSAEGHSVGERIQMIRVDDLGLTHCHLIKVDVEGMEARVLAGARQTVKRFRPVLYVENNDEERSPALLKTLDDLGYASWWHLASNYSSSNFFGNSERLWPEAFEGNLVSFPKEAKVNAHGLLPVEGLEDTRRKALRRRLLK